MPIVTTTVFDPPTMHILCLYGQVGRTPTTEHNLFCYDAFQEHPHINYLTWDVHIQDIYISTTKDEHPKFTASINHSTWNYLR